MYGRIEEAKSDLGRCGRRLWREGFKDVFVLSTQHRQDTSPSALRLTGYTNLLMQRAVERAKIEELCVALQLKAITDIRPFLLKNPKIMVRACAYVHCRC